MSNDLEEFCKNPVDESTSILSPEELAKAQSDLKYTLRMRGLDNNRFSYHYTLKTILENLVQRTRLPKNFKMRVTWNSMNPIEPPTVLLTATWDDIYDPGSLSMTYGKILGMEMYIPHLDGEKLESLWRHKVADIVGLMWDHELHEFLQFDGKYLYDPHPEGRDGPLG